MNTVECNLLELRKQIAPYKTKIIAVTKYFGIDKLIEAYNCGVRDFAENKVQDAIQKIEELPDDIRSSSRFHLIGHLQSNKVKKAVGRFDLIQSVDSLRLASLISEEAMRQGIVQDILIQVNNANEQTKSGISVSDLRRDYPAILALKGINILGLMNIAPIAECNVIENLFADMQCLKKELEENYGKVLPELSMGMSGDYQIAVKHGATMIRLGKIIFN